MQIKSGRITSIETTSQLVVGTGSNVADEIDSLHLCRQTVESLY